jgi:hypothetical protein
MKTETHADVLKLYFKGHDTINAAQSKMLRDSKGNPVRMARVAATINILRNEGYVIVTEKDATGEACYRMVNDGSIMPPKSKERQEQMRPVKGDRAWQCAKPGCMSGVVPSQTTTFDSRYTTGRCFTHGRSVVLVRA